MSEIVIAPEIDPTKIRHALFDMDGTLYRGSHLFSWTAEALALLDDHGIGFTYLTNNSSRSAADYLEKLRRFHLPDDRDHLWTSSLCTLEYMAAEYPAARTVYLLGTESLRKEFAEAGYEMLSENDSRRPDLLVVAFDTELIYSRLCKAAWWAKEGVPYIATHPDKICPTERDTVLVDCGAVTDCIFSAAGRAPDRVLGKPDERMISGLLKKLRLPPSEVMMVGDRLYTDMEMARRSATVAALVLSGETTAESLRQSDWTPDIVADNILTLVRAVVGR